MPPDQIALLPIIGRRIVWARELRGLTQAELSRLTGIEPPNLSKLESGLFDGKSKPRRISIFQLRDLVIKLQLSADYFLFGTLSGIPERAAAERLAALHPELVLAPDQPPAGSRTLPPGTGTPARRRAPKP